MATRVHVSLKLGGIGKSSRSNVRVEDDILNVDIERTKFEEIAAMANARINHALEHHETRVTRIDTNWYLKPSLHATQKDWVAVDGSNFRRLVDVALVNFQRSTKDSGPFTVELYAFASRSTMPAVRRATAARVQSAARAIDEFLSSQQGVIAGDMARAHWAMAHARLPEGTPPTLPAIATFAQMQHLDVMRSAIPQANREPDFRTITVRINGSTDLQLTANVRELRDALGLPHYNLVADGLFSQFEPPVEPAEDAEDVDHMSE